MTIRTLRLYSPHPGQRRIHQSDKRFNVVAWGRQSGKTTYGLNKISSKAWGGPKDGRYWYVLQTYDAARIAFQRVITQFKVSPSAFSKKPHETDLSFQYQHGPYVRFVSGKNYQDLRTETLDGVVLDEMRQQPKELWSMVIRPMLTAKRGWADFLSTTNGFDHFKDLYDAAVESPEDWATFQSPSTIAPWWTEKEIASTKSTMTEDEFAQEILAEFREFGTGKAYRKHGPWNHAKENPLSPIRGYYWNPWLPIVVGLDFNVGLMAWELMQHKGEDFFIGDEVAQENTDTEQMAQVLAERIHSYDPPHKGGIILIGDATGKARKTSAVGKTDYSIIEQVLRSRDIKVVNKTPLENPSVKDRVNWTNSRLKAADGQVHLWYNPVKCPWLKRDFERVNLKQGSDGFNLDKSKDITLTQASDAAGYPISAFADQWRARPGVMRIIHRTS